MPRSILMAALAAVLAAGATPAAAQTRNPLFTADQEACFGRVYDREHLASHPQQKTASIHIFRSIGHRPEAENWSPGEREEEIQRFRDSGETAIYAFATFRDRRGNFYNTLNCNKEGQDGSLCAVDCDGGSFKLKRENANAALLTNNGFVLVGGCGEEVEEQKTVRLEPGRDDKVFRLESKPVSVCVAEAQKTNPIPAGTPLRERFKEDEAFCFGRDYDAAHMAGHPQQIVASLRVGRLDPAAEKDPDSAIKWWWYNVKLSVSLTLKTGGKASGTRYSCYPEEGSWGCRRDSTSDTPSACTDRSIELVRGPDNDILVQNRNSGLPIDNECDKAPTGEQYPKRPITRSDDKLFRLSRMPVEACR
jgi:hypothetical protein